ncbi:MAG: hypothetical protein NTZ84_01605 [Candidatus Nealsonbacteria bacterium]|nr:hypothetical protein [Candidatus Nealsonbacteria bacterium]
MANQNLKQNNELTFSESIVEIIGRLVEEYKLDKEIEEEEDVKKNLTGKESFAQKAGIKVLFSKKVREQLEKGKSLDEILASRKLKFFIEELSINKIPDEGFTIALQKSFGLSQEKAEKLSNDLQENLLLLVIENPTDEGIIREEKLAPEISEVEKKDPQPRGKDIYKEQID